MSDASFRLIHPTRADKHVVVAVETREDGNFVVRVARGVKRTALNDIKLFGPFKPTEVEKARTGVLEGLLAEGYHAPGIGAAVAELASKNPAKRAHAARRLARLRHGPAVEPLLQLLEKPKEDVSTAVEALGVLRDPRAIPAVRVEAERKLLSRRRAGVEALRLLEDNDGLSAARKRALERLSEPVRAAVANGQTSAIVDALRALDVKERGLAIDTVYELADEGAVAAVRGVLAAHDFSVPHLWRYAKSVWKRAMLRGDEGTVGLIAHAVEMRGRTTHGVSATLKSGYDGETRTVRVFSRRTVDYVRRRTWRWLREMAVAAPEHYALAAAGLLSPYVDGDDVLVGSTGSTGHSYVLHQILFGSSTRYRLDSRKLRFRPILTGKVQAREESFPQLWDSAPSAYVRVLAWCRHSAAQRFALKAVTERHPHVVEMASRDELVGMLGADEPRVIDLALAEIKRRFDRDHPDLDLVRALCLSSSESVRNHGLLWLSETAPVWTRRLDEALLFLELDQPHVREVAARLVGTAVVGFAPEERTRWAGRMLDKLEQGERHEGTHFAFAEVVLRGLLAEALGLCSLSRAVALVEKGTDAALAVGAQILAHKPGTLDVLGLHKVLSLATHEKIAVRRAAAALLTEAREDLTRDPSPLFAIVECEWEDARSAALDLIAGLDVAALGLDALVGLADSTRSDVQLRAQAMLNTALERVDIHELLARLAQHPYPLMRRYALDLAKKHLKPGFVRLVRLEGLFRTALFSAAPSRAEKRAVIAFLEERGLMDEAQAEVAVSILGDFLRTRTVDDRERAMAALTQVKLRFPGLASPIVLSSGVAG